MARVLRNSMDALAFIGLSEKDDLSGQKAKNPDSGFRETPFRFANFAILDLKRGGQLLFLIIARGLFGRRLFTAMQSNLQTTQTAQTIFDIESRSSSLVDTRICVCSTMRVAKFQILRA